MLSYNPNGIELLKNNLNKINWENLSTNPNAIELLKENQDKIDWFMFSQNSSIYELKKNNNIFENIKKSIYINLSKINI